MLQEPSNIRVKDGKKETDECKPQRYLRKALAIAENFKYKYHLEQRVSSELARRRELCKLQRLEDSTLIDSIERELKKLVKIGYSGSDPYAASDRQSDASIITHKPTVQITANDVKHWAWAPEPFVGNDGEGVDESQTQRRLRKAVTVAEKFKNKYHLEQQVSSELARECDNFNRQRKEDREIIDSMEIELRRLVRLGYKGIGPVTARSTTSSTPAAALSPSKMTIAHFSDTNSIATIADDRAGVSVGTLDKHFSLSRISAKCLHEDKDGCVIKSEWNQEIDVNSTSGRLMGIEMYNEREVQTRTDKENEDGIGLQEERNMNRGMWKESDIAFSEEYMEVKGTEKWKVSKEEKEKERMMEQAKLIEEEREREMEMIREKSEEVQREKERVTAIAIERVNEIERLKLEERINEREKAAEIKRMREKEKERARERERERESLIEHEREREKAAEVERMREKEKERVMEQAKLMEEEREREMEMIREKSVEIQREKERVTAIAIERVNEIERLKLEERINEREKAAEIKRMREKEKERERERERESLIEHEREREKAAEVERMREKEKEKERVMEQAKLIEEEREREMEMIRGKENAIERERERGEAAEVEMMREKEKERARGREREKESVIERERESEKAAEVERIREKEKERAMEQAKLVVEEREREMGREIVTMKCVESGEELESYQERVEEWHRRSQEQHQSNRPKVLPSSLKIITSANDPKTGATTSIPLPLQPPFDVAKYDSKDSQGKVGVNNERVEERHDSQTVKSVYEEKSVVQGQPSFSSSVPSETILQPVTRPVLSVTVAAAVAADGDHSRPLATAIRRDPVPKLFEHFMVVGASFEVRIDLLEYSETQALRNPASLLLRM